MVVLTFVLWWFVSILLLLKEGITIGLLPLALGANSSLTRLA